MKSESDRSVTIEDLLRLKRAEVPPAEFWSTFDRELRAKQLAALVAKRPWWQRLPKAFSKLARYRIPLGASAVLAVTFFSVGGRDTAPAVSADNAVESVAIDVTSERQEARPESTPSVIAAAPVMNAISAPSDAPSVAVESSIAAPAPVEAPRALPVASIVSGNREADAPSSPHIAANLASIRSSESLHPRTLLDVASGFEMRVMPPRTAIEPLQQMTPPSDTRRSRLLTAMVSTASLETSTRTTARAASRIEEERLYDQIQRFGARADRVQMKF